MPARTRTRTRTRSPAHVSSPSRPSRSPIPARFQLHTLTCLAAVLLGGLAGLTLGGCELSAASEAGPDLIAAGSPGPSPSVAGVHRYLFTIERKAPAAEVEAFFQREIVPALGRDARVGDVATFADDGSSTYAVVLDLKTVDLPRLSLALDILGTGRSPDEAQRLIDEAASLFSVSTARELLIRPDLTIERSLLGTMEQGDGR